MKINIMSDLHLEFTTTRDTNHVPCEADVLVLAGDIDTHCLTNFVERMADSFPHVIYIFGNHEYYGLSIGGVEAGIRSLLESYSNIHVLQNETVTIDGVKFHGATLWSDMNKNDPLTINEVFRVINDYKVIQDFVPERAMAEHATSKKYLSENVSEGDVVVTHMAPSELSVHPRFKNDHSLNGAYASDLSDIMLDNKPALWVHGHVHDSFDYNIGDTRIVCNPRGYEGHAINPNFDYNFVVEI